MNNQKRTESGRVRVTGGFWRQKVDLVSQQVLPYQWAALNDQVPGAEPSHAVENFRIAAGEVQGAYQGTIWQDSDLAKWLEAASYSLADRPDEDLQASVDEAIRLIGKVQGPDGYVNTWFALNGPEKRWTDLPWGHELYCGGHLIEAAVAHFQATGSRRFLDIMARYADGLIPVFGPGGPHAEDACGHPVVEMALHRLAEATGETRYRDLAVHFVDVRGTHPERFLDKVPLGFVIPNNAWFQPDYFQAQVPVREEHHAVGHAVRAMYLYTAMARQAKQTGEPALRAVLEDLWTSVTQRRMYVTGGLGSHAMGERFTLDYDLPSDTAYTETCASIGLVFWAQAMLDMDPQSRYADVLERGLYNGVLSGMALDGKRFFYVNPLEVVPSVVRRRHDLEHVKTERVSWFGCSCCPPNIARLVASIGRYAAVAGPEGIRIDQFIDSEGRYLVGDREVVLRTTTDYPWSGAVRITVETPGPQAFSLALRLPAWCRSHTLKVNGVALSDGPDPRGYLPVKGVWKTGDVVDLDLAMPVRFLRAHPLVSELAGKVALARGPIVLCAEEVDNGPALHNLTVDPLGPTVVDFDPREMGGTVRVTARGSRRTGGADLGLYPEAWATPVTEPVGIRFVPYHQWGNRHPGQEMRVWLREENK